MNDLATIIYYTSNRENEKFEQAIRDELVKSSNGTKIISVSQKPIDLGTNICIGDVGANDINLMKQILIGCENATTPFLYMAEADCLYPPEYFTFIPEELNRVYHYSNLYMMYKWKPGFYHKSYSQCGLVVGREYAIKRLRESIFPDHTIEALKRDKKFLFDTPIINIKTRDGLRANTWVTKNLPPKDELPYWGTYNKLREKLSW